MRPVLPARRIRTRRGLAGQRGLTLIELLLSLTLLVVMTGFLAGGLQLARRAFDADRTAAGRAEVESMLRLLSDQIACAFPLKDTRSGKIDFDGRSAALAFTELETGHANRGGFQHALIEKTGTDLTIDVTPPARLGMEKPVLQVSRVVLLNRVAALRFSYFGRLKETDGPRWVPEWRGADGMPELVSLEVLFEDARLAPVSIVVALHQRS